MLYCGNFGEIRFYGILVDGIIVGIRILKFCSLEIMFLVNKDVWVELNLLFLLL